MTTKEYREKAQKTMRRMCHMALDKRMDELLAETPDAAVSDFTFGLGFFLVGGEDFGAVTGGACIPVPDTDSPWSPEEIAVIRELMAGARKNTHKLLRQLCNEEEAAMGPAPPGWAEELVRQFEEEQGEQT